MEVLEDCTALLTYLNAKLQQCLTNNIVKTITVSVQILTSTIHSLKEVNSELAVPNLESLFKMLFIGTHCPIGTGTMLSEDDIIKKENTKYKSPEPTERKIFSTQSTDHSDGGNSSEED